MSINNHNYQTIQSDDQTKLVIQKLFIIHISFLTENQTTYDNNSLENYLSIFKKQDTTLNIRQTDGHLEFRVQ